MDLYSFSRRLRAGLPEGAVLQNPGRGTTTIMWSDSERLCYQRGESRFYVDLAALHKACEHFSGRDVTTTELKDYAPKVFDSRNGGHNCHATVLFLALCEIGLADEIWGRGVAGSPFAVTIRG